MATRHYIKTVKTGHWKQARTKAYADRAKEAYERISNRGSKLPKSLI